MAAHLFPDPVAIRVLSTSPKAVRSVRRRVYLEGFVGELYDTSVGRRVRSP